MQNWTGIQSPARSEGRSGKRVPRRRGPGRSRTPSQSRRSSRFGLDPPLPAATFVPEGGSGRGAGGAARTCAPPLPRGALPARRTRRRSRSWAGPPGQATPAGQALCLPSPAPPRPPRCALPGPEGPASPQCARIRHLALSPSFPSQDRKEQPRGPGQGLHTPSKEPVSVIRRGNGQARVAPRTGDPGIGKSAVKCAAPRVCRCPPAAPKPLSRLVRRALPFLGTQAAQRP